MVKSVIKIYITALLILIIGLYVHSEAILTQTQLAQRAKFRQSYIPKATKAYTARRKSAQERAEINEKELITPTSPKRRTFNLHQKRQNEFKHESKLYTKINTLHTPLSHKRGRESLQWIAKLIQKSPDGILRFTPNQLNTFLSNTPHAFTTIVTIAAKNAYPPTCQSCRSFHSIAEEFGQNIYHAQAEFWNTTATHNDNNSFHINFPSKPDELSNPFSVVGNNGVVTVFLDVDDCREVFIANGITQAPFTLVLPPFYDYTQTLPPTFIKDVPESFRIIAGSTHKFTYTDYVTSIKSILPVDQINHIKLDDNNARNNILSNALDSIPKIYLFGTVWLFVLFIAFYMYYLDNIVKIRLFHIIFALLCCGIVIYQFSAPSILKDSKNIHGGLNISAFLKQMEQEQKSIMLLQSDQNISNKINNNHNVITPPLPIPPKPSQSTTKTSNTSSSLLSSLQNMTLKTSLPFLVPIFDTIGTILIAFLNKIIALIQSSPYIYPYIVLLLQLTTHHHSWQNPQARESYVTEIIGVVVMISLISILGICLVLIADCGQSRNYYYNRNNHNIIMNKNTTDNSNDNNDNINQIHNNILSSTQRFDLTLDADRTLALQRYSFMHYLSNNGKGSINKNSNEQSSDENINNHDHKDNLSPSSSSLLTPNNDNDRTNAIADQQQQQQQQSSWLLQLLFSIPSYILTNITIMIILIMLVYLYIAWSLSFEKKMSMMTEAMKEPIQYVKKIIKAVLTFFDINPKWLQKLLWVLY